MPCATELKRLFKPAGDKADPQEKLRKALIDNNQDSLDHCLARHKEDNVDLNNDYMWPSNKYGTCLHYAAEHGQTKAVKKLLSAGAQSNVRNVAQLTPLHLAVMGGHNDSLSALLERGADVNALNPEERSALHMLAKKWADAPAMYEVVLDTLLNAPGVNVDILDCSGYSPLLMAANLGAEKLCLRLVERDANLNCQVGKYSARDLLHEKFPSLLTVTQNPVKPEPGRSLYDALKTGDDNKFIDAMKPLDSLEKDALDKALNTAYGKYNCLEFAANSGMVFAVGKLLEKGADFGSCSGSVLDSSSVSLQEVVSGQRPSALSYACLHGYHEILDLLLKAAKKSGREVDLLQSDVPGQSLLFKLTAPHKRCADLRVDNARCLHLLLECGQPVGENKQDNYGNTPLHFAALQEDQCLVVPLIKRGANIGIVNKFDKMPVMTIKPVNMEDALDLLVSNDSETKEISFDYNCLLPPEGEKALPAASETAPLFFMGQSRQHKRLLQHPVISSFITVKWHKIQRLYMLVVALYTMFVAILTTYVYLEFDLDPESSELRPSPLVSASGLVAMKAVLWVLLVLMVLRELLELKLSWLAYPSNPENYLQVGLIILLAVMLSVTMSVQTRLHIAVLVIILAWLKFFLLLGSHPMLSTYIMMFKRVSENFIKFILLYSSLIISFSIAFHLLFRTKDHFNTYWRALLKTVVMSTGEMEYTTLKFTHPACLGHIAFFGFLFLIVLVLMNLLNGLAVSDTAKIQADAELNSLIARVRLIHHTEVAVLELGRLRGGCCVGKTKRATGYLSNACHWLERKVLTIPCCGKFRSMTARLVDDRYRLFCSRLVDDRYRLFCCDDKGFGVDKKVVDAALALVLSREQVSDDPLERKLDALMKMVQEIKGSVKA